MKIGATASFGLVYSVRLSMTRGTDAAPLLDMGIRRSSKSKVPTNSICQVRYIMSSLLRDEEVGRKP